jgi:hypothetical protein
MLVSYIFHQEIIVNYEPGCWDYFRHLLSTLAIIIFVSEYFLMSH